MFSLSMSNDGLLMFFFLSHSIVCLLLFTDVIDTHSANWCFMVPSVARLLLDQVHVGAALKSLTALYLGGEAVRTYNTL